MKQTGLQCKSDVVCSKTVVIIFLSELGVINPFLSTFALQSLLSPQSMSHSASLSLPFPTIHLLAILVPQWVGPWFLLPAQVKQHQAGSMATFYVVWGYELGMKNRRKRRRRDRRRRISPLSPYNPHTQSVQDPTVSEGDHTETSSNTLAEKGRAARAARCSSSEI